MKKLSLILAVLLLVPAMAAVNVTVSDNADLTGDLDYVADANVSAFALTISVDGGAVITGFTPTRVGESITSAKGYGIFPGTIDINDTTGIVAGYGTPVVGTLPASSMIVEMGALYGPGDANKPGLSGTLGTITVDKACNVTVALEPVRGGIVYTTALPATLGTSGGAISGGAPAVCLGDVDGDTYVTTEDLSALLSLLANATDNYYPVAPGLEAQDIDGDTYVTTEDLSALLSQLANATDNYWACE